MADHDLAVVGAGIVGMSAALWAQSRGLRVLLCDRAAPGSGASFGNAGTIATYACLPVNSPSILRDLPRLLTSADSPLSLDPRHALAHPRWMLSFLANCRPARVAAIAAALSRLLAEADAGLDPLIALAKAEDLVVANDCLYVWTTRAGFDGAQAGTDLRRRLGVACDEIGPQEIRALEPALRLTAHRGLRFRGARHITDPQALIGRMHSRFLAEGGTWFQAAVTETRPDGDGVTLIADGQDVRAARAVIAAGAWSRAIRGSGAERLPLDTERGYHLVWGAHRELISRPVGWAEAGFYATPMAQGLRLAGTVEIAGLDRPPNRKRLTYIARKGAQMFGELGPPNSDWLGFRPSFPDALPVIGPSPASDRILLAFGHQHLGLTLGGITGRIVADLAEGRPPDPPIADFAPSRF